MKYWTCTHVVVVVVCCGCKETGRGSAQSVCNILGAVVYAASLHAAAPRVVFEMIDWHFSNRRQCV